MLTLEAASKGSLFPVLIAGLLIRFLPRASSVWTPLAAFCAGGLGAFSLNSSILRNLPSMLGPGQLHATTVQEAWLSSFVEAALPEEFAKGVWMLVFLVGWRQFTCSQGALVGGLIGLGFALRENLGFGLVAPEWRITAALSHGAWGIIMGTLFDRGLSASQGRFFKVAAAFLPTIVLHGLLDCSIFLVEVFEAKNGLPPATAEAEFFLNPKLLVPMASTFMVDAVGWVWAVRIIRQTRRLRALGTAQPMAA